jgi:hypothetical protein
MKRLLALTLGVALAGIGTAALATRNSSGTYSLPQSPFISGTVINSSTMNSQFGDIAQSLTDSLDRNGKGPMLAPLRVQNGSNTAPSLSFNNDQDTGLYLVGDANPAVTVAGTKRQEWTSTGTAVTGTLSTTGNATVGGTLGVTGAETVGGTLGVTGATTLAATTTATLSCTNDATFTGNVNLTLAGDQGIWKSNGKVILGTLTNHAIDVRPNSVTKWSFYTDGSLNSAGGTIAGLPTPTNSGDAATKGYVDTTAPRWNGTVTNVASTYALGTFKIVSPGVSDPTVSSIGTGHARLTHASLSSSSFAIVQARNAGTFPLLYSVTYAAGSLDVYIFNAAGAATDGAFAISIIF